MSVIFLLIPLSIVVATFFLVAFIWAVRSGQYEDTLTPAMRVLLEETSRAPLSSARRGKTAQPAGQLGHSPHLEGTAETQISSNHSPTHER